MKKFLASTFLVTAIVSTAITSVAAAASVSVSIEPTYNIVYSDRLYFASTDDMTISVGNYWDSQRAIIWTLYGINGGAITSGYVPKNDFVTVPFDNLPGSDNYYLKLECYGGTGCKGNGTLSQ